MGIFRGPNTVRDSLVLALDATSPRSYPGSGNTWFDLSGNGLNGTLVNETGFASTNGRGEFRFDGSNDKIQVDNIPQIFSGSVSMESWFYWNDDSRSIIFGNYNVGANDVNWEKNGGRSLRFYWNRGERDVSTATNVVTTTGEWHHVVMVRDLTAGAFRFYVNGSLIQTTLNVGSNIASTGSTFRIGGDTRDGTTVTNGGIGSLKLYNKALSTEEVTQNFTATRNLYGI
jgi:hypothetical protein